MIVLCVAVLLVKFAPMRWWKASVGISHGSGGRLLNAAPEAVRRIAAHVEQACRRLPFAPKCLPRAVTVQWLCRMTGCRAVLVIAKRTNPDIADAYHAWVEADGDIVIGQCDRSHYHPILVLSPSADAVGITDPNPAI